LVEVIRGDRRVLRVEGGGRLDMRVDWTDPAPPAGETWYYVRVTQEDNSLAWSSPIWVRYTGPELAAVGMPAPPAWDDPPYWPPDCPESCDPAHMRRLEEIFAKRGLTGRFVEIHQVGVFSENRGRYALFRVFDGERNRRLVHIHLYLDFRDDRLYIADGASDYGVVYKWD
jgi:hypothetical protein